MVLVQEAAEDVALPVARWQFSTRLAFRFFAVYFLLFVRVPLTPFNLIPAAFVQWVAASVFGRTLPLVVTGIGSGDRLFDWVRVFCALVLAVVATAVWSLLDRRRPNYERLHRWLRLFVRFWLGSTMVSYGMMKVIPVQMPEPHLFRLLQPFGDFSPMGVLWWSIGVSPAYERFIGAVELIGGLLLFVPFTVLLGALISLVAAIQVFVLNMTYDVPAKLLSFHLILFSMLLLAPDARRLINVLLLNRTAGTSTQPLFGRTRSRQRLATFAQIAVGLLLTVVSVSVASSAWSRYGAGAPKPPLYGVWNVEEMTIDDLERAPLVTDVQRWRRVVFEKSGLIVIQGMDGRFMPHLGTTDSAAGMIVLRRGPKEQPVGRFDFSKPRRGELTLDGNLRGRPITARLRLVDAESFLVRNRGFHWVQEYPFNR